MALRIGTLNVHMFMDSDGEPNVSRLVELLRPQELDVLGLQEVLSPCVSSESCTASLSSTWYKGP